MEELLVLAGKDGDQAECHKTEEFCIIVESDGTVEKDMSYRRTINYILAPQFEATFHQAPAGVH